MCRSRATICGRTPSKACCAPLRDVSQIRPAVCRAASGRRRPSASHSPAASAALRSSAIRCRVRAAAAAARSCRGPAVKRRNRCPLCRNSVGGTAVCICRGCRCNRRDTKRTGTLPKARRRARRARKPRVRASSTCGPPRSPRASSAARARPGLRRAFPRLRVRLSCGIPSESRHAARASGNIRAPCG